jgi:protein-ribulosamine 3-kinase
MRLAGVRFGRKYLNAYHEKFGQAEPTEDAEDRLALYALYVGSSFSSSSNTD